MAMDVSRKESMSPDGFLHLHIQDDGDVILTVVQIDDHGELRSTAFVEFCTPFGGGGGSPRTHKAMVDLAKAMAADNADPEWQNRAGNMKGAEILEAWK